MEFEGFEEMEDTTGMPCPYCGNMMDLNLDQKVGCALTAHYACLRCGSRSPWIFVTSLLLDEKKVLEKINEEIANAERIREVCDR